MLAADCCRIAALEVYKSLALGWTKCSKIGLLTFQTPLRASGLSRGFTVSRHPPFGGGIGNVARNSTHILFASVAEASGTRQLAAVDGALIEATKFGERFG